jgi:hypothetical protein
MSTVEAQFSAAGIAEQHQARADTAGPKGTTVREPLNLNVLQLGPSLAVRGGISAVERLIVDELAGRIALRHVPTMEDGPILREARCSPCSGPCTPRLRCWCTFISLRAAARCAS